MKMAKRIIAVMLVVLTVCAAFAGCSGKKNNLVVGITNYEPMDYKDKDGSWTGFDAEFAEKVAEKLGYDGVEFVEIEWDNKFKELNSGAIDCVWNGMTISDSVTKNCDVSKPYASNSQVIVMKKADLAKYPDEASFKDVSIAVEKGSAGEAEAKKLGAKIISLTAQSDALKEVKAGTAVACIIDSTMANSMTKEGTNFADLGYEIKLTKEVYGVGFKKGSELTEKVNAQIDEMMQDGTLQGLSDKYGVDLA